MNATTFNLYGRYYDLLYTDKDYSAEVDYIANLLKKSGMNGISILEFGSGTGIHGRLLADRGFLVTGVERSLEMSNQAVTSVGFNCINGDIRSINLQCTFSAVIAIFHVISYQAKNNEVLDVFNNAARHLEPGGLFVFDVWYTPAVHSLYPEVRLKRFSDKRVEVIRIAEPTLYFNDNQVEVTYTIIARDLETGEVKTFTEKHLMRHFSLPELELFARISGFELIGVEEFLTGDVPSEKTWGVCFVMKKNC